MEKESTIVVEVELPDSLAREAEERGLLTSRSLEALLREELKRQRIDRLFEAADQLAAVSTRPLTQIEVETEIQTARRERRSTSHASSS